MLNFIYMIYLIYNKYDKNVFKNKKNIRKL